MKFYVVKNFQSFGLFSTFPLASVPSKKSIKQGTQTGTNRIRRFQRAGKQPNFGNVSTRAKA